ncbi:DUF3152 domain-containing protein [Angustibacter luteus]|uniref:DUF3152 domain-containing protein n=1 Tax=Angustibacter luteus TaxID=658456 RepID=A0ABW1JGX9_9ACTN
MLAVAVLAAGATWWLVGGGSPPAAGPAASSGASSGATSSPTRTPTESPTPTATVTTGARPTSTSVATAGTGRLVTVPGDVAAPGRGPVTTVRVRVEQGVDVDEADFANQVMATLNDSRSWGHGGRRSFARTDASADVDVVLASPTTSARLCRPLQTFGKLSCRSGRQAVLTSYRWVRGTPEFPELSVYRQYVVNHEVGHVLGHGHEQCPGAGRLAPVMQQQTKQVAPCRPNAWPYP